MRPLGNAKRAVGLEWTGHQLRWAAVEGRPEDWRVTGVGACPLTVEDWERGVQRAEVTAWLTGVVREHRLRGARTVLGVPPERVLVRYMTVPRLPAQALKQAMELEIGNTLHVPFEHPALDVVPVEPLGIEQEREDSQTACLVVTDRTLVEGLAGIAHAAGLRPIAAEVAPLPLWRLSAPETSQQDLVLWLSVDEGVITSSVCLGEALYFLRTIADAERVQLTEAGAEFLVHDLAYEAERVVNFFNFTLAGREYSLGQVWLHAVRGSEAFAEQMAQRLQRPVRLVEPAGLRSGSKLERAWYSAAGLALRGLSTS